MRTQSCLVAAPEMAEADVWDGRVVLLPEHLGLRKGRRALH